jgi:hypothetical protein
MKRARIASCQLLFPYTYTYTIDLSKRTRLYWTYKEVIEEVRSKV